jgi:hypothetical protein
MRLIPIALLKSEKGIPWHPQHVRKLADRASSRGQFAADTSLVSMSKKSTRFSRASRQRVKPRWRSSNDRPSQMRLSRLQSGVLA